ncbi:MAG: RNA-binding protein, partial [Candidatus Omnitrophica bacterium]|nr:RNA-binding protein [Candidatus Omnitrophota bacterium]
MQKKLYVGNLNYQTVEQDLEGLFAQYGKVVQAEVVRNRYSGRSKGFGFVQMEEDEAFQKALEQDGQVFMDRTIRVSEAKPPKKDFRPGGGGGGGRSHRGGGGGGG